MYVAAWSQLSKFGLSPDAQVVAAHQLVAIAPQLIRSREFQDFATVDIKVVDSCTVQIRAAVQGSAKLSPCPSTPPDLASEIAATEIDKEAPTKATKERFFMEYRETWGDASAQQLREKLTDKYAIETKGYTVPETIQEQKLAH